MIQSFRQQKAELEKDSGLVSSVLTSGSLVSVAVRGVRRQMRTSVEPQRLRFPVDWVENSCVGSNMLRGALASIKAASVGLAWGVL